MEKGFFVLTEDLRQVNYGSVIYYSPECFTEEELKDLKIKNTESE